MKNENSKTENGSQRSEVRDPMGIQLEQEDETTAAIVYGCFVGLLVFFLAAVAAIIFL